MKYKFIGKPDKRLPELKTGKIYDLEIKEIPWGFLEWAVGIKHPQIVNPFSCPYTSWKTFNQNWVKESRK